MSLRLPNGEKAKTDEEHMSVFHPHCIRIFNNHRIVSPEALEFVKRETYQELDNPITWEEFNSAVTGMNNDKSPGTMEYPWKPSKPWILTTSKKSITS